MSILENANNANYSEKEFIEMVEYGYKLALEEKCLGFYKKIQLAVNQYYRHLSKNVPSTLLKS